MRRGYLPELLVCGLVLLLVGWLFVLTADYVVNPVWVWIFGPVPVDQPWLIAFPVLVSALLVWVELRGLGRLADFLILRAEKRHEEAPRNRGRKLP